MNARLYEEASAIRFDATRSQDHVESHFVKGVSKDGERALWLKHTILYSHRPQVEPIAEVWAIAFSRRLGVISAAKQSFGFDAVQIRQPFLYRIGESSLERSHAVGVVEQGEHRLSWELDLEDDADPFWIFPRPLYNAPFPRSKTLTPQPRSLMHGVADVDGERWEIDAWIGMQGHNWGRSHAESYAWIECNDLVGAGEQTWVESISGRVRVAGVLLPWMHSAGISVHGRLLRFDGVRSLFARAPSLLRSDSPAAASSWRFHVELGSGRSTLEIDVHAATDAMAGLHYANPDGSMIHCLNAKLAEGRFVLRERGRPELTLSSDRVAFEIGTKRTEHGVTMLL